MDEVAPETGHVEKTAGEILRSARTELGKSISDISATIRVPERMLDALERDAISELPVGPYAIGFARSYAKALGLDETAIITQIRRLQQQGGAPVAPVYEQYEPADTFRIPSRTLAWTAAGIALAMVIAYLVWKSFFLSPDADPAAPAATQAQPTAQTSNNAAAAPVPAAALASDAPVRIAASASVWFSLEDAQGRSQFDLTLQGGEFYTLRPEQRGLFLRTGRPQAMRILIGDTRLPQLAADDAVVSGVALDSASLNRRLAEGPAPAPVAPTTSPRQPLP